MSRIKPVYFMFFSISVVLLGALPVLAGFKTYSRYLVGWAVVATHQEIQRDFWRVNRDLPSASTS